MAGTLRRQSDDEGFTLVEVLVAILLLGIIGGFVLTSVVQALQVTSETSERTDALTDVQRGLERVSRQIRTADPLEIDPDGDCAGMSTSDCVDLVLTRRLDATTFIDGARREYAYYLVDTGDGVELRQDLDEYDADTGALIRSSNGEFIADIANLKTGTPLFQFKAVDSVSGALKDVDCTTPVLLDVDDCRSLYATSSVVKITLEKLLRDDEVVSASTAATIRNTRYEP